MLVKEIKVVETQNWCELRGDIIFGDSGEKKFNLWYRFPIELKEFIKINGSPFVVATLLPSMVLGEDLYIDAEVSKKLEDNLAKIMDIYCCWDEKLMRIKVKCKGHITSSSAPIQIGSFFTLGVDSFYTLLKNIEKHPADNESINYLVFVHGFDIGIEKSDLYNNTLSNIQRVAKEFNMKIIPVATNLRVFSDSFANWGELYHGAALASVGLAMEEFLKKIYIASTGSYAEVFPCGSNPLLDPLWSTERLMIVNDGCEARRIDKIVKKIANYRIALDTLRVCYINPEGKYNCGLCPKCIRTMIGLHIAGVLNESKTFPHLIQHYALHKYKISGNYTLAFTKEILGELGDSGVDRQIKYALEESILRYEQEKNRHSIGLQIKLDTLNFGRSCRKFLQELIRKN